MTKRNYDDPAYKRCVIGGCNKPRRGNVTEWCEMHYYRNRRNGSPNTLKRQKYVLDDHILDRIDSDDKAWFLGLMWSDGWISHNSVGLKSKDKQLLKSVLKLLKSDFVIKSCYTKGREYYVISLASKVLSEKLREFGMFECKSLNIEYPTGLPDEFFGGFYRGVSDGDGTVYIKENKGGNNGYTCKISFVSASKNFVDQVLVKMKNINVSTSVTERLPDGVTTKNTLYVVSICSKESKTILYNIMYPEENDFCLFRKREKFRKWFNQKEPFLGRPSLALDFTNSNNSLEVFKVVYQDPKFNRDHIMGIFNCSWRVVVSTGKKLGLIRRKYWSKEDYDVLDKNQHLGDKRLYELLPWSKESIRKKRFERHGPRESRSDKCLER
jgi:hypothetical protein